MNQELPFLPLRIDQMVTLRLHLELQLVAMRYSISYPASTVGGHTEQQT